MSDLPTCGGYGKAEELHEDRGFHFYVDMDGDLWVTHDDVSGRVLLCHNTEWPKVRDGIENFDPEDYETTPAERLQDEGLVGANDYETTDEGAVRASHDEGFYRTELENIAESDDWQLVKTGDNSILVREVSDDE